MNVLIAVGISLVVGFIIGIVLISRTTKGTTEGTPIDSLIQRQREHIAYLEEKLQTQKEKISNETQSSTDTDLANRGTDLWGPRD